MSGAPIISGRSQFPNPPMKIGVTKKNSIRRPWAVIIVLYSWSSPRKDPGCPSSVRIISLVDTPKRPAQTPNRKYSVPISLWFVEKNQRIWFNMVLRIRIGI
jgi:hypothetical protein